MSKKITKVLALLLVCVMLMGSFTGCGNKKEEKGKNSSTKVSDNKQETKTKKDEKPVEIQVVVDTQPNKDAPVIKKIEEKYNIKFNWDWVVDKRNLMKLWV